MPAPSHPAVIPVRVNEHYLVLDQDGAVLVGADNDYDDMVIQPLTSSFFFYRGGLWHISNAHGTKLLKAGFTENLCELTSGYFSFERSGKHGVIDAMGREVQAAAFDDLFIGEGNDYLIYEVGGRQGVLSVTGERVTEPVFERVELHSVVRGWLVMATRNGEPWIIDLFHHEALALSPEDAQGFSAMNFSVGGERDVPAAIRAKWQWAQVDEQRAAIFGYAGVDRDGGVACELRAMYRLEGTPVFEIVEADGGGQQLLDGAGEVIWPV